MKPTTHPVKVWDAPTRLFHWAIVALVIAAYATITAGWIAAHFYCGYAILSLVLFRIAWGVVGSDTARFARFVRSPLAALAYLRKFAQRGPDTVVGHNAAGGWMVLVLLALLAVQATTGLFANDEAFSEGPLAKFVGPDWSDRLSGWHIRNFNLILAAVALHVLAVLSYAVVKRHDLVRPMITGLKALPVGIAAPRMVNAAWAALVLAAAAGAVWLLAALAG